MLPVMAEDTLLISPAPAAQASFSDIEAGSALDTALIKLKTRQIINGYEDNTVKPKNNATRAEATAVLQRFIEKINQINNN